jgi:hypothetical protein
MRRVRCALPVLDPAIDAQHRIVAPGRVGTFGREMVPVTATLAQSMTLTLDPPPSTLPIGSGNDRPLTAGAGGHI